MIDVVQFDDGKYGLQNNLTGYVLRKNNGRPRVYRSVKAALKGRNKLNDNLMDTIAAVMKNSKEKK